MEKGKGHYPLRESDGKDLRMESGRDDPHNCCAMFFLFYNYIINQKMTSKVILEQSISKFNERLLATSERKTEELPEFNRRGSKVCSTRFTLTLMRALELEREIVGAGLLLAKAAVDTNLKISKKFLNRLIALGILLAEKLYSDDEVNSLESYSLVTGIPIKELAELELKMMLHLDYHLMVPETEVSALLAGEIEVLFDQQRNQQ